MDNEKQQQIEALTMATEYMDKLIPSMETVVSEIKGEMQEDTVDYLKQITDGLNFMIEVYNVTRDLVNEKEVLINDDVLSESVANMSDGFAKRDYAVIADEFDNAIIPFLKVFNQASKEIIAE